MSRNCMPETGACRFTLKRIHDMKMTYSKMDHTDKSSQHSSFIIASFAKLLSLCLRTKWLWVWIMFLSFNAKFDLPDCNVKMSCILDRYLKIVLILSMVSAMPYVEKITVQNLLGFSWVTSNHKVKKWWVFADLLFLIKNNEGWFLVRRFVDLLKVSALDFISRIHFNMVRTSVLKLSCQFFCFCSH